jgi:RNA-directed DNA polymerase
MPSERDAAREVGVAHSTEEAGQRPWREGAAQGKLPGQGATATPEVDTTVSTKLSGLVARARKEKQLTNVIGFVDEELLVLAFRSLRKSAGPGVDGQSYEEYAQGLAERVSGLYQRMKQGQYQAPLVKRAYIPKPNGGQRPLGIPTVEDRMVQKAVSWVLSAVYEQDFLESSQGFRPQRGAHGALRRVWSGLEKPKSGWVVEVDIVGFFDHVNHVWLQKFLAHRVNDGGLRRLVGKWLQAGVLEQGIVRHRDEGTPQGGPISPILANIYLHYALDLWFEGRFKQRCKGQAELTRYADDFVAVFENQEDAERFRAEVEERLEGFGLSVSTEKTAVVRMEKRQLRQPGRPEKKPGSFTFLGMTFYLRKTRYGRVQVGWRPSVASRERFLHKVKEWLKKHRHERVREQQKYLGQALRGYDQYFGLPMCLRMLSGVRQRVLRVWRAVLRRRSQRTSRKTSWRALTEKSWFHLPEPQLRRW